MLSGSQSGFTLLEVLITIVILAFGLLGLTSLQAKLHVTEMESYQRVQAIVLLQDIANGLQVAGYTSASANYVTGTANPVGTGDGIAAIGLSDCEVDANYPDTWDKDECKWSVMLKGGAETAPDGPDAGSDPDPVGGMIGARACIEEMQPPDVSPGVCTPGIYRVTLAWQGLFKTSVPGLACGQNLYGDDDLRRVISTTVTIGLPKCESL